MAKVEWSAGIDSVSGAVFLFHDNLVFFINDIVTYQSPAYTGDWRGSNLR